MSDNKTFNPNDAGVTTNNIFGLPYSQEESTVILLPVPWEVTVSYGTGTAAAPAQLFTASMQIDLYDAELRDQWQKGFYMLPPDSDILTESETLRQHTEAVLALITSGEDYDEAEVAAHRNAVNAGSERLNRWVYDQTAKLLKTGKRVALIGGDHSTPFGFIKALAGVHDHFGILQIDAHADLRTAYEGFKYSHASIMYNVIEQIPQVSKLVQVGIRDYCDEEAAYIENSASRIVTFFDKDIKEQQYQGGTWHHLCMNMLDHLPQKVYISFDIDGLDPKLCPDTGTPVPGGFELAEVFYLFKLLHQSGRQLIGFDVNEVGNGRHEGDSINVVTGARAIYKLCNYLAANQW